MWTVASGAPVKDRVTLPHRYDAVECLGRGGGGEVWSVRDCFTHELLALKLLAADAGEPEYLALVREAIALSGLEGLGVPKVVGFGTLPGQSRRYFVRELVPGLSLERVLAQADGPDWTRPFASACDQLTVLHRAGLLHGDIKPANIIARADGVGTLVDLGLAAPWREGGAPLQGLTPKYAAPELFTGEPLTVRAEVFSLGATLREALKARGSELPPRAHEALTGVFGRALRVTPSERYPSVDELVSAFRQACQLPQPAVDTMAAWPVMGADAAAERLIAAADELRPGDGLSLVAPAGAGKTTLLRRLAWTLGIRSMAVAFVGETDPSRVSELLRLELQGLPRSAGDSLLIIDDLELLGPSDRAAVRSASARGVRIVAAASREELAPLLQRQCIVHELPPLELSVASELVARAMPSLADRLRAHLVARAEGRPGVLRAAIRRLAGQVVVSSDQVDEAIAGPSPSSLQGVVRAGGLETVEQYLDTGRLSQAKEALTSLPTLTAPNDVVRAGVARARLAIGEGDARTAAEELAAVRGMALEGPLRRAWLATSARAKLRSGEYRDAVDLATTLIQDGGEDGHEADALAIRGVALALTGEDESAALSLDAAVRLAKRMKNARFEAIALGSTAIMHQRAGRSNEARMAYEESLAAAERAGDAATIATMRLNLAGMCQSDGNVAQAILHLEAAVDMGRRAGAALLLHQALINLASLDLFLGRYSRAEASIQALKTESERLSKSLVAQLAGLEAELCSRTGDGVRGGLLYRTAAQKWRDQDRLLDAAEATLEGLLVGCHQSNPDVSKLATELAELKQEFAAAGFGKHAALASLVDGQVAKLRGDESLARRALDAAVDFAHSAGRSEWIWQCLHARARLFAGQGNFLLARRDTDAALAILEDTASRLPRDLREVFWDDSRRKSIRVGMGVTQPSIPASAASPNAPAPGAATSLFVRPVDDRLPRLLEIVRELAREKDLDRLLGRVTEHAVGLLRAERGFVLLINDAGELSTHAARARQGEEEHARFSRSVAERVTRTGEPVVTLRARDDERLAAAVSVHQLAIESIACVPIRGAPPECPTIGALYVETRLRPGARFQDELPILQAFADQAAVAIEYARVLAENKLRADELAKANAELAQAKDRLAETLGRRTEQLAVVRRDLRQVRDEIRSHFGYAGLVGTSAAMRRVYAIIDRVKGTDIPVLVTGESGTGKEVIAKAIHSVSPRAKRAFIGVNCGAIPANLLESELFGALRGAFTGADRDRKGLFREADGGSILLDEIGEMPHKMQAGLLRVLQERTVRPVGGTREEEIDTRVIAATNRDLRRMVAEGTFREDLFYRLNVVEIVVPSLRERAEDIPALLDHFMKLFSVRHKTERKSISREALRMLCAYHWPGNVRQLENVLLNAWLMGDGDEITPEDISLPEATPHFAASTPTSSSPGSRPRRPSVAPSNEDEFRDSEKSRILGALSACNWNRVQAAKMVGIPRRTFYRRMKEFGILE